MDMVGVGTKAFFEAHKIFADIKKGNSCHYFDNINSAFSRIKTVPPHLIVMEGKENLQERIRQVQAIRKRGFRSQVALVASQAMPEAAQALLKIGVFLIVSDQLETVIRQAEENSRPQRLRRAARKPTSLDLKGKDKAEAGAFQRGGLQKEGEGLPPLERRRLSLKGKKGGEQKTGEIDIKASQGIQKKEADPLSAGKGIEEKNIKLDALGEGIGDKSGEPLAIGEGKAKDEEPAEDAPSEGIREKPASAAQKAATAPVETPPEDTYFDIHVETAARSSKVAFLGEFHEGFRDRVWEALEEAASGNQVVVGLNMVGLEKAILPKAFLLLVVGLQKVRESGKEICAFNVDDDFELKLNNSELKGQVRICKDEDEFHEYAKSI